MKLDQLNYFHETARLQHMGQAAKSLAISVSAISHAIEGLETELACKLFLKQGKRIYLTDKGRLLMERARKLLDDSKKIKEELSSANTPETGHYRLSASHLLSENYLLPVWNRLKKRHPMLSAELYTQRSAEIVADLLEGRLDLGICFSPQDHPELEKAVLHRGQLYPAVRRLHPDLKKLKRNLSLLSRYGAVLPKARQGIEVYERHPMFSRHRIGIQIDTLIDSYDIASQRVAHSLSWGFFPDIVFKKHKTLVSLKVPGWDAPYTVSAIWRKERYLSRVLDQLIETTKDEIGISMKAK